MAIARGDARCARRGAVLGRPRRLQLLSEVYAYIALASMWNLLAGYAGLVSVGQQAYVGLGAYLLFALTILIGAVAALGDPACRHHRGHGGDAGRGLVFRLRGHYFAIGTWIIAEVFRLLASQVSVLGGGSGISLPASLVIAIAREPADGATSSIIGSRLRLPSRCWR